MPHNTATGELVVEGLCKDFGAARVLDHAGLRAPAGAFVAPERCRIGMVFQDGALVPHLTVAGNVGYGLSRSEGRAARVAEALALVDLDGFGDRLPASLSGGQAQRVALARALVTRPLVLLLDEPFSNQDTVLRVQIRAEVRRLLADLGSRPCSLPTTRPRRPWSAIRWR